jgi:hypothetical protein
MDAFVEKKFGLPGTTRPGLFEDPGTGFLYLRLLIAVCVAVHIQTLFQADWNRGDPNGCAFSVIPKRNRRGNLRQPEAACGLRLHRCYRFYYENRSGRSPKATKNQHFLP